MSKHIPYTSGLSIEVTTMMQRKFILDWNCFILEHMRTGTYKLYREGYDSGELPMGSPERASGKSHAIACLTLVWGVCAEIAHGPVNVWVQDHTDYQTGREFVRSLVIRIFEEFLQSSDSAILYDAMLPKIFAPSSLKSGTSRVPPSCILRKSPLIFLESENN